MSISFSNSTDVFIFIIFCSVYVCSILWIYGDAVTRNMKVQGSILAVVFVIVAALALTKGILMALIVWPIGYIFWFKFRPKSSHAIIE